MKKYIVAILIIIAQLKGMDLSHEKKTDAPIITCNNWDFFAEPNIFDTLPSPIPYWNKGSSGQQLDIETIAHLHILKKANLNTKNLKILDITCAKGHTTTFLSQNALSTIGYDNDIQNIRYAQQKNQSPTILYCDHPVKVYQNKEFDLIIGNSFIVGTFLAGDKTLIDLAYNCLMPTGKIFCTIATKMNEMPLSFQAFFEVLPAIKKAIRQIDQWKIDTVKAMMLKSYREFTEVENMIAATQLKIISLNRKKFDILIQDKDSFINFHTLIFAELSCIKDIHSQRKKRKISNQFMKIIVRLLKKDENGNWLYPIDTTALVIEKKNINPANSPFTLPFF